MMSKLSELLDIGSKQIDSEREQCSSKSVTDLIKMESQNISNELDKLQNRFDDLKIGLGKNLKKLDSKVHDSPYPYLLGALGVGFLAAKLMRTKNS